MQRPKTVQRSTAAVELRGWRHEEDEEKETKGRKGNDPSVLFIRQGTCVRRANPGATRFGSGAAALGIADLLIKEGVINVNFIMTSCRFTATRDDDDMAVYQLPEDVEDKDFYEGLT